MMSLWDALRMNMMISYQELVRTFLNTLLQEQNIKFYPRGASAQIYPTTVLLSRHVADLSQ